MEETKTILDWFIPLFILAVVSTMAIWHPYTNANLNEYARRDKHFFWAITIEFAVCLLVMMFEFFRLKQ